MDTSQIKVAVIGGGPQGLCALKNLLEEGFDATLFERRDCIGGLWAYTDDANITTVLESTLANVSKYKNCFADFPTEDEDPVYLTQKQLLQYLEKYVEAFGLRERTELNTEVVEVARSIEAQGGWNIKMKALPQEYGLEEKCIRFDKVIVATGQYHTPHIPTIKGANLFSGKIIHSSRFKRPSDFRNLNVMVVGFANTAADISTELVGHAKSIYVSHRRGIYAFPRLVNGKPLDLIANRRLAAITGAMAAIAPIRSISIQDKGIDRISKSCFKLDPAWNFRPAPSRFTNRVMVSDTFVPRLTDGSIKSVANLTQIIDDHTVELADGSHIAVDCIVLCTGYARDPPLISGIKESTPASNSQEDTGKSLPLRRLYQNIFPPAHADSLAFLDCWQLSTGVCEVADLESMAIAQIWKGAFQMPSESQMNREIDAHHRWVNAALGDEPTAAVKAVQEAKWRAWLNDAAGTNVNEKLGYGFQGWWFWLTQPRFCNLLMSGVDSPHVMRLFDGRRKKWGGARDAIIRANDDVEKRYGKRLGERKEI